MDENFTLVKKFSNAREVSLYFSKLLPKGMSVGNIKNARRFKRPIGKQLSSWYYVCYDEEIASLKGYIRGIKYNELE